MLDWHRAPSAAVASREASAVVRTDATAEAEPRASVPTAAQKHPSRWVVAVLLRKRAEGGPWPALVGAVEVA